MRQYAKALVATIGAAATSALAIFPPHTVAWDVASVAVAVATAVGVYFFRNEPAAGAGP